MKVTVAGGGAFGTALAIALSRRGDGVTLWARDPDLAARRESPHLRAIRIPEEVTISAGTEPLSTADIVLVAVPAQALRSFVETHAAFLDGKHVVACCKGIDMATLSGPVATIGAALPAAIPAILSGPGFAADLARGLPTAMTLACGADAAGHRLQHRLSTPTLRLYRTTDTVGAELGGALKNVIAIACGACIGAGLGDSARAALVTRGFAEIQRLALPLGAEPATLAGLSGLGDLVLTCTSDLSRNFRFGLALGRDQAFDPGVTVEGVATARAVAELAGRMALDLPITSVVAALCDRTMSVPDAMNALLARPLKEE